MADLSEDPLEALSINAVKDEPMDSGSDSENELDECKDVSDVDVGAQEGNLDSDPDYEEGPAKKKQRQSNKVGCWWWGNWEKY